MAQHAKGRWIKIHHNSASRSKEINHILDEFHKMATQVYPQPTGVDVTWHTVEGISYFGSKKQNSPYPDGSPRYEDIALPHFRMYYYRAGFFAYRCDPYNVRKMNPGYLGETGTWVTIIANEARFAIGKGTSADAWMINGMPVTTLNPGTRLFSGDGLKDAVQGRNYRIVLIHRKGVLPYTPVTRRQYLERCILYTTKLFDDQINRTENLPVRSLEEQVRDEQVQKLTNLKAQELKKFTDELERTTQQGLLDTPAMIRVMYDSNLIFDTDPLSANMVVIQNRDYIRTDLPKHVPQLFVISWEWGNWPPFENIAEIMEKDFPFEKLQAMIDK